MALLAALLAPAAYAQTTYTWNAPASAAWGTPTNWTPARNTTASTDILVFDGLVTANPVVTGVVQQTIGVLRFTNNVNANLSATAGVTLTISGASPALDLQTGSTVTLAGASTNPITLSMGASSNAVITGSLVFTNAAHVLTSGTANSINFNAPGSFTAGTAFSGSPFGTSGTGGVVQFNSGSSYTNIAGNGPWGLTAPSSRVSFNPGSKQFWRSTAGFQTSGRTFGNLFVQNNTALSGAGTLNFVVDTLNVEAGSSFTHTGSGTGVATILGDVLAAGTGGVSITPGSGGIQLSGGKLQTFAGGGTGAITFGGNATIGSGTTLAISRTLTFSTGTMTVNGTFQFNQSGAISGGGTWTYGAGATLSFAQTTGSFAVSSSSTFWPAANGPTNVTVAAGGITMNSGATRTIAGTLQTSGPITGANLLTLSGTFRLNAGGSVAAAPIYSGTATLLYNTGFTVGPEWGTGSVVGAGVPSSVNVTAGAGTLTMPNSDRTVPANLTITSGTMVMNASSGNLTVGGNWTDNGTFTVNGRTVTLTGSGTQSLSRTGGETFATLVVSKTGGSVQLGSAVTCAPTGSNQALTFNGTTDVLNLNGQSLTLNGPVGGTDANATLSGSGASNLTLVSSLGGSAGTLKFTTGAQSLGNFTVNLSGASGAVTLGTPVTANGALTLTAGVITGGTNTLSVAPTGSVARTSGWVNGTLLERAATGTPTLSFPIGTATAYTPATLAFNNVTVAGDITAKTTTGDHPSVATSGLVTTKTVNRYWTLANVGATFGSVDATFDFVAGDVDAGTNTDSVEVREFASSTWSAPGIGARTATSTQGTGITVLGDFAIGEPVTWTITSSAGANGTISPLGTVNIRDRHSLTYAMLPNTGFAVQNVLVDGSSVGAVPSYTFAPVTANHTISVTFQVATYNVTLVASGNGTVTADHPGPYLYHSSVTITATPALGNLFSGFTGDLVSSTNPIAVLVDSTMTVVANFTRVPLDYSRSTIAGAYSAINTGTGATRLFSAADDSTQTVSLPFGFTFSGITYTTSNFLAVNANGFAYFSRAPVTASNPSLAVNSNLFSNADPNAVLAPWYDDLSVAAVGTNPAGSVLFQTQGVAGSRTLTVQWTNVSSNNSTAGGQPRRINFQLVLFEASQAIEFRYGTAVGTTYSNLESASLGIEDSIGGNGYYIDGVTGSRYTNNGMLNTNRWPSRFIRFTPISPTPLGAGTYTVGSGQTYANLTDAVADLNLRGVAGPVTFQLTDAVYDTSSAGGSNLFPVLIGPVAGTSAVNTVTIQSSGPASIRSRGCEAGNCGTQALPTAISTSNEPVIALVGTSYVTLKNLSVVGGNLVDRGVLLLPTTLVNGAQNNTLHTIAVTLTRTNTSTIGVQSSVPSAPSSPAGTNSSNRFFNLNVQSTYAGVSLAGNAGLYDDGNLIGVADGGTTTIGGPTAGDIGNGTPSTFGIRAINQSNVTIRNCIVQNVLGTSTGTVDGISLDNLPSSSLSSGVGVIAYNLVQGLSSTSTNGGRVTGIRSNLTTEPTSSTRIFNNFVTNLTSQSTVSVSRRIVGIMVQDGGSGGGATQNVDFNSVRLQPSGVACSNACFESGSAALTVGVRDNVFANFTGTQSGTAKHYTWVSPALGQLGAAGSVSDYNVLYVANVANGFVGLSGGDRVLLSDWQSITGADAHSLNGDPQFVSASDLHINTTVPTPVAQAGSFMSGAINWVPDDFDSQARNSSNPDIGADEGLFQVLTSNDIAASSFIDPVDGATKNVGTPFSPQAQYTNTGFSTQSNIPVRYQIRGPLPASTLVYDQGSTIALLAAGAVQNVTFPPATINVAGPYEIRAICSLPADQNTLNDVKIGSLDVSGPLNGTYSVGSSQLYPFNSLTNAITRLNAVGVAGPVVYQLLDPSYGPGETFPLNINALTNGSATNTFTVRPAPGVTSSITGSAARAIFVLNGADYVTINGSNTVGGTTRDLTVTNTSSSMASAVVWAQTTSGGDPATNDAVMNSVLIGSDRAVTLYGVGFGGSTIALKSPGNGNNNNRVQNCDVRRAQYGIYSSGYSAASKNSGTVISGNVIDNTPTDAPGQGGIYVRFEDGIRIDHNRIGSISTGTSLPVFGISLGLSGINLTSSAEDEVTNATVSYNTIAGVAQTNPAGYGAGGIVVSQTSGGVNTIYNNMITGVLSPAYEPDFTAAILVGGGGATRIYFNSVAMTGTRGSASAGSFCVAVDGADPVVDIRDNIFFTSQTSTGPGDAYMFGFNYLTPFTNLLSDYNDCYALSGQFAVTGGLGNSPDGDVAALSDWRTLTSQDAHTFAMDPLFVSATNNLHIASTSSPIVRAGVVIAGITDDIDGDPGLRASQPSLGCDEFVTYTIATSVTGSGTIAKSPDLPAYISGSTVQIQAFPSGNWHFVNWGGDLSGTQNPQNIVITANKSISATFAPDSFTVDLTTAPAAGGTASRSPSQPLYPRGTTVVLTATPNTNYHFTTWSGDTTATTNPLSLVVTRNRALEADFALNSFTVTATGVANGSVTKTPNQPTYDYGSSVRLNAIPNVGYSFVSWGGDTSGTVNPLDLIVTRNRTIQATFALNQYTLTVNIVGSGSVSKSPNQATYNAGTIVTLTATPSTGNHFVGWSGDTTATTNPLPLPMIANRTVTATFAINTYAVTLSSVGAGSATKSPDLPQYNHGTPITFTGTPQSGQSFSSWSGDTSSTANPLNMTVTRPLNIVARFTVAVNITIVGSGSVTKNPNLTAYPLGSIVQLTATPITGWHFVGWSGDTTATTNPLSISLPTTRNLTATFAINTYTLQITTTGDGTVTANPQQATYDHGTVVQLTATPGPGNSFITWGGDASGSTNPLNLTMNANKVVTATFSYKVTVTSVGLGSVTLNPNQANYAPGTAVTLTATPQTHVHFTAWSGDTSATTNPLPLVVTRNRALTATFVVDTVTLNVTVVGNGSVTKNPNLTAYDYGTAVTLTAVPGTGWHFVSWSGDTSATTNPLVYALRANRNVTATFAINTYLLNVSAGTGGTATKSPIQATYDYGTQVTLTATPNVGYHFGSWSGDTASSDNPFIFRMVTDHTLTAGFVINQYPLITNPTGNGTVARNPDLPTYTHGTQVTLTAAPSLGWHFAGWTGDTTTATNPLTFIMTGPRTVTAVFQFDGYVLTINITGGGTVAKSPDAPFYPLNTTVDLTATPQVGFRFTSWGGAASGTSPTTSVVMNANLTVTAQFDTANYTLSATSSGPGTVGWNPVKATYRYPDLVTLTGTPGAHAHFVGWSGDTTAVANPLTIVMNGNRSLVGTFALDNFPVNVSITGDGTVVRNPNLALYDYGTPMSLTATANVGSHFTTWSGDTTTTTNPLSIIVTRARSITAVFDINTYALTTNVVGPGIIVRDPDLALYPHGTSVDLYPTPNPGAQFVNWGGDLSGTVDYGNLIMTSAHSVTATFALVPYTLTVQTNGPGSVTKVPNQATYTYGTAVKLTAAVGDTAHHFHQWGGVAVGTVETTTVIIRGNSTAIATFDSNLYPVNITVQVDNTGTVSTQPASGFAYYGSYFWAQAMPAQGYQLEGWHGDIEGNNYNPIQFPVNGPMNLSVRFNPGPPPILDVTVIGRGTVTRTPDLPSYQVSTYVTVRATPDPGYHFQGWSGNNITTQNPILVFMDRDHYFFATFLTDSLFTLTTAIVGQGTVTKSPDQPTYAAATPVQLTATPSAGWNFAGWSGGATGTANPMTVTMTGNLTVTANFVDAQFPVVKVSQPNGGERFVVGNPMSMVWLASGVSQITSVDFLLSRTGSAGTFSPIATGQPNTGSFSWVVTGPATNAAVVRIVVHDAGGRTSADVSDTTFAITTDPTGVDGEVTELALSPVWPDPVRDQAVLRFSLPQAARVRLSVIDLQGREVAVAVEGEVGGGRHEARLQGGRRALVPGLYFARLRVGQRTLVRRFIVAY